MLTSNNFIVWQFCDISFMNEIYNRWINNVHIEWQKSNLVFVFLFFYGLASFYLVMTWTFAVWLEQQIHWYWNSGFRQHSRMLFFEVDRLSKFVILFEFVYQFEIIMKNHRCNTRELSSRYVQKEPFSVYHSMMMSWLKTVVNL